MAKSRSIGSIYAELSLKDKMSPGVSKASKSLNNFATIAGTTAVAAITALSAALVVGTRRMIAMGAELEHMSKQTGMAVADHMVMRQAFKDSGLAADESTKAINKMQRMMVEAGEGSESAIKFFNKLGLSLDELNQKSQSDRFYAIGAAINSIEDPAVRAALAVQGFGKSGTKLLTVFDGTKIDDVRRSLGKMPAVMEENRVAMERVDTLLGRLPNKMDQFFVGFTAGVVGELIPALETIDGIDLTDLGTQLGRDIAPAIKTIADAIADIDMKEVADGMSTVLSVASKLGDVIKNMMPGLAIMSELGKLNKLYDKWFEQHLSLKYPLSDEERKKSNERWDKLVEENRKRDAPPDPPRDLFGEWEASEEGQKYIARQEKQMAYDKLVREINSREPKNEIPFMLKKPSTDVIPDWLLRREEKEPEKPDIEAARERETDEYIKRGLQIGGEVNSKVEEKQLKTLLEIRDDARKAKIKGPLKF